MANNNKHTGPNVPALRFPEFSGEWTKDCLNEFLEVQPARNTQGIYSKDDVLSVSGDYGVVNQIQLLGRSFAGKDVSNYHIVRTNDIVYTKSPLKEFPYGIVKTNQGTAGIVSTLYAVYSAKSNTDPKFVEYYFSSKERTNKYFKPIVRIGAKHDMKIGNEEVLRNIVVFPSKQEQNKIQEFLRIIDERIATQSKIIEELKTLRGALVNTYINDGNNNNENQTIMSLGAYGCFVRGLTYSSVDVTDDTATTGVVRSNNLEYGSPVDIKADLVYVTKKPRPEQMLVNGDIVICMANGSSSLVGKASNYQELCRNMTVGAFCGIYRGTHPLTKWIFMSSAYCKAVANAIQGGNGAIANLHAEDILSMYFAVPSDYKTITELGKLLSLFDKKLHAAEEQLARFIEQKKYFLFKMFI